MEQQGNLRKRRNLRDYNYTADESKTRRMVRDYDGSTDLLSMKEKMMLKIAEVRSNVPHIEVSEFSQQVDR